MMATPPLPKYKNNLSLFLYQLREYLFLSQKQVAAHFYLDRSRISRYENINEQDIPYIGYLAGLVRLVAERAGNNAEVQQSLLREANEAVRRHYSQGRFQNWKALCRVADAYLAKQQNQSKDSWQAILEKRLEFPTYTKLFGVEDHLDSLLDVITSSSPPWLVSIEGLGGIGKTSLAHALSHRIISQRLFDDFGWVSARQHIFKLSGEIKPVGLPAALTAENLVDKLVTQLMSDTKLDTLSVQEAQAILQTRLKQYPHLIVIDNLETVNDVETLLPTLYNLVNPSKFLLTSRKYLYEPGIYHFSLPELDGPHTLKLIRYEIELHNLTHLKQASDDDLKKIYEVVGGNPLAIRLVVGQTHGFSLDVILDDLAKVQCQSVEQLYNFIYRRAWDALDEPTRHLFVLMPLIIDEGESLEELVKSSGLDSTTVHTSLKHLVDLNLVNSTGDCNERRYSLHNLTRTFLQKEVLKTLEWE